MDNDAIGMSIEDYIHHIIRIGRRVDISLTAPDHRFEVRIETRYHRPEFRHVMTVEEGDNLRDTLAKAWSIHCITSGIPS
jgi:hypothetical protein